MIENLPNIEETLAYKQLVAIGEKRGEKHGKQAVLIKQIKQMERLNQKGELDDNIFTKLCEPLKKDLKKVTAEIDAMLNRQKKERQKKINF